MVVLLNGVSGALARQNAAMEYKNECVHAPAPLRQMVEKTVKEQTSSFRHAPAVNAPNLVSDDWFRCHMKKVSLASSRKKQKVKNCISLPVGILFLIAECYLH